MLHQLTGWLQPKCIRKYCPWESYMYIVRYLVVYFTFLWFIAVCDKCYSKVKDECPEHGPMKFIEDVPIPEGCEGRARRTLPNGLEVKPSPIEGVGVFAKKKWKRRTRFGPYQGTLIKDEDSVDDLTYVFTVYWTLHIIEHEGERGLQKVSLDVNCPSILFSSLLLGACVLNR